MSTNNFTVKYGLLIQNEILLFLETIKSILMKQTYLTTYNKLDLLKGIKMDDDKEFTLVGNGILHDEIIQCSQLNEIFKSSNLEEVIETSVTFIYEFLVYNLVNKLDPFNRSTLITIAEKLHMCIKMYKTSNQINTNAIEESTKQFTSKLLNLLTHIDVKTYMLHVCSNMI